MSRGLECDIRPKYEVRLNDHTKEIINGISTLLELVTDKATEWFGQKCIRRVHNELRSNLKDRTVINIARAAALYFCSSQKQ